MAKYSLDPTITLEEAKTRRTRAAWADGWGCLPRPKWMRKNKIKGARRERQPNRGTGFCSGRPRQPPSLSHFVLLSAGRQLRTKTSLRPCLNNVSQSLNFLNVPAGAPGHRVLFQRRRLLGVMGRVEPLPGQQLGLGRHLWGGGGGD